MADWKEILSDNDEQLSEEELLKYLKNDIEEGERFFIEKKISKSPFETDAIQGLAQIDNKEQLQQYVKQLNQKLQQLTGKRHRSKKRQIKIFEWIVLAIMLLLFVCVIGYIIISLQNSSHTHTQILDNGTFHLGEYSTLYLRVL